VNIELAAAVNLLTRDSKHRVADADGRTRFVTVSPLLVQLKLAIANSTAAGSGMGGGGAQIPLGAAALDLYTDIKETVRDNWWQTYSLHKGHGRGKVALELRAWAASVSVPASDQELALTCLHLCKVWVASINGLLQPVRRWEVRGACPACKRTHVTTEQDGERITGHALSVCITDVETWAECLACGEKFIPENLARQLASG
jgi:hypothetical protein